jgi:hypothetical protein
MKIYHQDDVTDFMAKATLHDICNWMKNNPTLVGKNFALIEHRISHMNIWVTHRDGKPEYCTIKDIWEFFDVILNRSSFTNVEFDLLNLITNNVIVKAMNGSDCGEDHEYYSNKAIATALMDIDKVREGITSAWGEDKKTVIYNLYQSIIDVYIPSSNPEELIRTIDDTASFTDMIRNAGDTKWIIQKFKSKADTTSINLKEIVLFFKILSDIYENHEAAFEFLHALHHLIHTEYWLRSECQVIVDRYQKFFESEGDGYYFVARIFCLLSGDNPFTHPFREGKYSESYHETVNVVDQFLLDYSKKYSPTLNTQILHCMVNDAWVVISKHDHLNMKKDRCAYMASQLLSKWGTPAYNVDDPEVTEELKPEDTPISTLESYTAIAMEAVHKDSPAMNDAEKKIYKAYRTYKDAEEKVDSQITKAVTGMKNVITGDVRSEIIEGKKFSAISLLKQVLGTVGLFSIGPVKAVIALVVKYALKKKTTTSERRKILMELDTEIEMITEKIEDARGDGNREAKYAMMRTKKELENAKDRIRYGIEADTKSLSNAKSVLNSTQKEGGY